MRTDQSSTNADSGAISTQVSNCAQTDDREVLSCRHCKLVQFRTRNSLCRRCSHCLDLGVQEPGGRMEPSAAEPDTFKEENNTPGARVREARQECRLTQHELGKRMGVPRTYISKVESERTVPSLRTLARFARSLEVSLSYLVCGEGSARTDRVMADPLLREIAQVADKLSSSQRALILRAVREMATDRTRSARGGGVR